MNTLVLAPHPDDETIGCGGSLWQRARQAEDITVVYLTSGELGLKQMPKDQARKIREKEARAAAAILGISKLHFLRLPDWEVGDCLEEAADLVSPLLEETQPRTIYLPHPKDAHPDHQACWPLLKKSARKARMQGAEVRAYEIWSPLCQVDYAVDITRDMPRKMRALRAHGSQLNEFDYEQALRGLNLYRGALHGKCRYAEVFMDLSDQWIPQ